MIKLTCRKTLLLIALTLSGIAAGFIIKGIYTLRLTQTLNCQFNMVVHNYGLTAPLVGTLQFSGERGVLFYNGPVYAGSRQMGVLGREIDFTGTIDRGIFTLVGTGMRYSDKNSLPEKEADLIITDFFTKPNVRTVFTLRYEQGGYFFIRDSVPMFFCRNN